MDGNQNERNFRKPGVAQVCIIFSITIILFVFIGCRVQNREIYSGLLITEFGLIMLPALIFLLVFRFNLKNVLKLNDTKPLNFLLTFAIMLFTIPMAGVFNLLNLLLVNSIFGKVIVQQPPIAQNGKELLIGILVIAGSAGICEEFLFRGVMQRGFERFGAVKAILLSALLFSLTHLDFQKIFGTFLLGALIGFIVYRTNSLYCGVFAHFINNALAVLISYAAAKLMSVFGSSGISVPQETDLNGIFSSFRSLSSQQLILVFFIYGFMFLCIAVIFVLLLYALIKLNPVRPKIQANAYGNPEAPDMANGASSDTIAAIPASSKRRVTGLLWLLPGILLIAGIYFIEVHNFTGVQNDFVDFARRLLL